MNQQSTGLILSQTNPSIILATSILPDASSQDWRAVEAALSTYFHKPDILAARALLAAIAAHGLPGQPVWPMLVAPPGSMKTELLSALDGLPKVHIIDEVTPQTFISGQIQEPGRSLGEPSLLHRIGHDGILVFPDFSTVLGMKHEARSSILGQLRRIYDGSYRREFGTSETARGWKGRITFATAVTPDIDRHFGVFQTLGERFVPIRWPRADGVDAALCAMRQDMSVARGVLRESVQTLVRRLPNIDPTVAPSDEVMIASLGEFAVRARTFVPRSVYGKEMIYIPEPESPTRLSQQLLQLAKGSALLDGRASVNNVDLVLARRVALDTMPPNRRKVVDLLIRGERLNGALPASTLTYVVEDLQTQGLLEGRELSEYAKVLLGAAGVI